jgi:tRNA threonylcarbamoyladenosine biosynthesis protein TsaB
MAFLDTESGTTLNTEFTADRDHTRHLFPLLEEYVAKVGKADRIAVGTGPGSYAGIRVAISTASGLALAWGAELVGIPSVALFSESRYLSIGDARRDSFYFAAVSGGECLEGPSLATGEELGRLLAADRFSGWPVFTSDSTPTVGSAELRFPCARILAGLALDLSRPGMQIGVLEPLYLREPHITQPTGKK